MFRKSVGLHLMEVSAHVVSSSSHLPTTSWSSCCLSPSPAAVAGKCPPAGPCSLGLFLLSICHISIIADAYLLRYHHIYFSVFWAWQPLEMHSSRKEGIDLVIRSLQSEGKPVPSSEAFWQLFVASWHLPFNEMSPFVSSKSDSTYVKSCSC